MGGGGQEALPFPHRPRRRHTIPMAQHTRSCVRNATVRVPHPRCPLLVVSVLSRRHISLTRLSLPHNSFYCWGPSKPPMEMSANEQASWSSHLRTPVLFNHHAPIQVKSSSIQHVNLNPIKSTTKAVKNEERVLILTPLKDASRYLSKYFELLAKLSYPHQLIDLAFLVGDTTDDTLAVLAAELDRIQRRPDKVPFGSAMIVEKDFGFTLSQDVQDRHGFAAQAPRRKAMARARNYLLATALKPEHSWVYWRDVDIVDSPEKIIEDFIAHDRDILVPSTDPCSHFVRGLELILDRRLVPPLRKRPRYRRQMQVWPNFPCVLRC